MNDENYTAGRSVSMFLVYIINWTFDGKWFSLAVPCVYPLSSNTIFFVCFSLTTFKQQSKDCSLCKRNLIWRDQILGLVNSGYNHDYMFIVVFCLWWVGFGGWWCLWYLFVPDGITKLGIINIVVTWNIIDMINLIKFTVKEEVNYLK